jgi:hypothetical protein
MTLKLGLFDEFENEPPDPNERKGSSGAILHSRTKLTTQIAPCPKPMERFLMFADEQLQKTPITKTILESCVLLKHLIQPYAHAPLSVR